MRKIASEKLFAYTYLENADQEKYGSILKNLLSQKSLGNDQYPQTIVEANNVLSNHTFDNPRKKNNNQKNKNKDEDTKEDDNAPTLTFVQMEGKCYCCGKPGHYSNKCRKKDSLSREEWAINKAQKHVQTSEKNATIKEQDNMKEEPGIGWTGVHCSFAQARL